MADSFDPNAAGPVIPAAAANAAARCAAMVKAEHVEGHRIAAAPAPAAPAEGAADQPQELSAAPAPPEDAALPHERTARALLEVGDAEFLARGAMVIEAAHDAALLPDQQSLPPTALEVQMALARDDPEAFLAPQRHGPPPYFGLDETARWLFREAPSPMKPQYLAMALVAARLTPDEAYSWIEGRYARGEQPHPARAAGAAPACPPDFHLERLVEPLNLDDEPPLAKLDDLWTRAIAVVDRILHMMHVRQRATKLGPHPSRIALHALTTSTAARQQLDNRKFLAQHAPAYAAARAEGGAHAPDRCWLPNIKHPPKIIDFLSQMAQLVLADDVQLLDITSEEIKEILQGNRKRLNGKILGRTADSPAPFRVSAGLFRASTLIPALFVVPRIANEHFPVAPDLAACALGAKSWARACRKLAIELSTMPHGDAGAKALSRQALAKLKSTIVDIADSAARGDTERIPWEDYTQGVKQVSLPCQNNKRRNGSQQGQPRRKRRGRGRRRADRSESPYDGDEYDDGYDDEYGDEYEEPAW